MTSKNDSDCPDYTVETKRIIRSMQEGVREAMKLHIAYGVPMVIWEDGKIVDVPPEKLSEILKEELPPLE
jgi:membrane protease subunit (stomatin/prohibitin family)